MSDLDLHVVPLPLADNSSPAAALRELADTLATEREVVGLGICLVFCDGAVGSRFIGSDYVRLLGALRVLEGRVEREFERP